MSWQQRYDFRSRCECFFLHFFHFVSTLCFWQAIRCRWDQVCSDTAASESYFGANSRGDAALLNLESDYLCMFGSTLAQNVERLLALVLFLVEGPQIDDAWMCKENRRIAYMSSSIQTSLRSALEPLHYDDAHDMRSEMTWLSGWRTIGDEFNYNTNAKEQQYTMASPQEQQLRMESVQAITKKLMESSTFQC
jgi:hypothetical protein